MTRRARMGPIQTMVRGADRMAPGGRRSAAESKVRPFRRPVRAAGVATPVTMPATMAMGISSSRFNDVGVEPTSVDVVNILGVYVEGDDWYIPPLVGDPVAAVVVAQGPTVTAPAGWRTLATGTLGAATYRIAVIDSYAAGVSTVWTMPGATMWVCGSWAPTGLPDSTSPLSSDLTWDVVLGPVITSPTATWPAPDPAWLYSIPGWVCGLNLQMTPASMVNSLGTPFDRFWERGSVSISGAGPHYLHVEMMTPNPAVVNMNEVSDYFAVGGRDSLGRVWHPDNPVTFGPVNAQYPATTPKQMFLLGLK